jgi:hypothetical protein
VRALFLSGLAIALAIACGSKEPPPDPRARCAEASNRDMLSLAKKRDLDALDLELEDAVTNVCVDDNWSPAIIACFTTEAQLDKCRAMLTPEQRSTYAQARMRVQQKRMGKPQLK